jgi:hypothetical protein
METTAADIEWIITAVSLLGSLGSMIAILNVLVNRRVAAANNGWLLYLSNTELSREAVVLIVQMIYFSVGLQSLFIGQVPLPPDGTLYRQAGAAVSILMSVKTFWSQYRYHQQRKGDHSAAEATERLRAEAAEIAKALADRAESQVDTLRKAIEDVGHKADKSYNEANHANVKIENTDKRIEAVQRTIEAVQRTIEAVQRTREPRKERS